MPQRAMPYPCPHCRILQATAGEYCVDCLAPIDMIDGRYVVLRHLATGGCGDIYKTFDRSGQREVVVKTLRAGHHSNAPARFRREIQITRQLSAQSPHAVEFVGAGEDREFGPYYAMEKLRGSTLQQLLSKGIFLPLQDALGIVEQLCSVLAKVHSLGVIHRDLKPSNVFLIQRRGDPYFVKLLDYGLAKDMAATTEELTQGMIGSPRYMAPEQARDQPVGKQADIYTLALLIYELLTLSPMVQGKALEEILEGQLHKPPEPLSRRCPNRMFPMGLEWALFRALEKDPSKRPQSIAEFWQSLEPFVDSNPNIHTHTWCFDAQGNLLNDEADEAPGFAETIELEENTSRWLDAMLKGSLVR